MINKKVKSLRRARKIAIFCFVISIAASLCILSTSFLDGPASAKISDFIKSIFQTVKPDVDIDYGDCSGLHLAVEKSQGYIDDVSSLTVSPVPAQSNLLDYTITVEDNGVAVLQEGKLVFVGEGDATVTVSLVDNASVSYSARVRCIGYNPQNITDVVCDQLFGTDNTIEARSVEEPQLMGTTDGNNYKPINWLYEVRATVTDLQGDPTDLAKISGQSIIAYKTGQVMLTLSYGADYSLQKQVVVDIVDNGVNPMPTTLVLNYDSMLVSHGDDWRLSSIIDKVLDENGNDVTSIYKNAFFIESDDSSIIKVNDQRNGFRAVALGTASISFTCAFSNDIFGTIPVTVELYEPTSVHIVGDDYLYIYGDNQYQLLTEGGDAVPNGDVSWTVVKGNAEIDASGLVTVSGLRRVTISASITTSQGTLTATRQLKVRFYQNFPQFIRKIAGHFTAFFILGFCVMAATITCAKHKKLALPIALAYGLFIAFISEVFQLPIFTSGRSYSNIDVVLNFMGAASGSIVALLLFVVVLLLIGVLSKSGWSTTLFALRHVNVGGFGKKPFENYIEKSFGKQLQRRLCWTQACKSKIIKSRRNGKM